MSSNIGKGSIIGNSNYASSPLGANSSVNIEINSQGSEIKKIIKKKKNQNMNNNNSGVIVN